MKTVDVSFRDLVRQVLREELADGVPAPTRSALDRQESVFTVEEVADLLRTSPKAVYARAARGQLPGAFHVGRSLRFHGAAIRSLVAGRGAR